MGSHIYVFFPDISGHSKIRDFANVFVTNQNISRGQVAMNDLTTKNKIIHFYSDCSLQSNLMTLFSEYSPAVP